MAKVLNIIMGAIDNLVPVGGKQIMCNHLLVGYAVVCIVVDIQFWLYILLQSAACKSGLIILAYMQDPCIISIDLIISLHVNYMFCIGYRTFIYY